MRRQLSQTDFDEDYGMDDFLEDTIFLQTAREFLGYSPDRPSLREEDIQIARKLIKIKYDALAVSGGYADVNVCSDGTVIKAFRNIYLCAEGNRPKFRKNIEKLLNQDWRNLLLLREMARVEKDTDLEHICDENIRFRLDNAKDKKTEDGYRDEISSKEAYYSSLYTRIYNLLASLKPSS